MSECVSLGGPPGTVRARGLDPVSRHFSACTPAPIRPLTGKPATLVLPIGHQRKARRMNDTLPDTMRAVAVREPGGPEVLEIVERPLPEPGEGEVLIRAAAPGV